MLQRDRLKQIMGMLKIKPEISMEDIIDVFHVSRDTARRDLVKLKETGAIVRIKGGAIPSSHPQLTSYLEREISSRKERIADAASLYIHDEDTILLDTSTTVGLVAHKIGERRVKVVTNSVDIVMALSDNENVTLYALGGKFNPFHRNFIGPRTTEELRTYRVDTVFLGACGLGIHGLTSPDEEEAYVKKGMIQAANQVILVTDHSKFQKEFLHKVGSWQDIDVVITNEAPPEELQVKLQEYHITLIITDETKEETK